MDLGRVLASLAILAIATPAQADDFWAEVIEPHHAEVHFVAQRARATLGVVDPDADTDWAVSSRTELATAAFHLAAYARGLSPENPEALELVAESADRLGRSTTSLAALEFAVQHGDVAAAPTSLLGVQYHRLGRRDRALRWLHHAVTVSDGNPPYVVELAHAIADGGDATLAIDLLADATPNPIDNDAAIVAFALAVQLDRDEQIAATEALLGKLAVVLGEDHQRTILLAIHRLRFAAPEDQLYYRALAYELSPLTRVEARAEWAHYAAFPDAPHRKRALDHITRLDTPPPAPRQRRVPLPPPRRMLPGSP